MVQDVRQNPFGESIGLHPYADDLEFVVLLPSASRRLCLRFSPQQSRTVNRKNRPLASHRPESPNYATVF